MATTDLHEIAANRLAILDQRYTRGRQALVEVLAAIDAPLTITGILEREASLSQSSAYRNLGVLEQAGVVHRIITADEFARYELAEDLTEHHHHLICSNCGAVRDFTLADDVEHQLDLALRRVAKKYSFDAEHHRLDLMGVCADCR